MPLSKGNKIQNLWREDLFATVYFLLIFKFQVHPCPYLTIFCFRPRLFRPVIQKGTILHKKYSNMGLSLITQLLSGENAGILWHRSRMTRIMTTHD